MPMRLQRLLATLFGLMTLASDRAQAQVSMPSGHGDLMARERDKLLPDLAKDAPR